MTTKEQCPNCKASLKGDAIPKKDRKAFGGARHFSRKIGLYDLLLDKITAWKCPDCKKAWERK